MKKSVLLFVGLVLTAVNAIAQPAKPEVAYTDWDAVVEKTDVYLYNVEAGMFLSAGSSWGTRATMVGTKDKSTYNDLIMCTGEFKGRVWYIQKTAPRDGFECYQFMNNGSAKKDPNTEIGTDGYLAADNLDGIWVDGYWADNNDHSKGIRPIDGWYIAKDNGDKTFQLGYMKITQTDGGEDEYSPLGLFGLQKFVDGDLNTFIDASDAYTTWALVSVEEYNRVEPLFKAYYAALGLKKTLEEAKAQGINADFSSYDELLTNNNAEYADFKAAIDKLSPAVNFGKKIIEAKEFDAARGWSKFEEVYANSGSTNDDFTNNTALINALITLKKAIDAGVELDANHDYSTSTDIYKKDDATLTEVNDETARVNAFISLKKKLNEAVNYTTLDLSEQKNVYNNAASTAKELADAEAAATQIINEYKLEHASLDDPGEITSKLTNVDGTSASDWAQVFTGEGTVGGFACNTWSVEADNGNDGTNMVKNFLQSWVAKGSTLSNLKIYHAPVKVAPGAYKLTANIRIYNESGADYMKGAYIFANNNRVSLFANEDEAQTNAVEGAKYNTYNGMLNYWKDGFEVYTIVGEDGNLSFGVQVEDANYNWIAFKNFRVYSLGDSYESLDYVRKNTEMTQSSYEDEDVPYQKLLKSFNDAVAQYLTATSADAILASANDIVELPGIIDAYKEYVDKISEIQKAQEEKYLTGPDADRLMDYLDDMGLELGPDSEEAQASEFENGYAQYILAQCPLNADEIKAEKEFLVQLYNTAVKNSLNDGDNITDQLVNPDFSTNDWTGWTKEAASGGNVQVSEKCAEAWNNSAFDIYQEQEGLPEGLYEISVQGFYRYKRGNPAFQAYKEQSSDYVKEGGSPCYVYMNTMSTPFTNVFGEENKGLEFYGSSNYDTYTYGDNDDKITEYYPNGMSSAAVAFAAGMYTQTAYGLVMNGEKMRIGVKGSSNQEGDSWVIFDNFKLTFRGKNPEVAQKVLTIKAQELKNFIENAENGSMTDQAIKDANYALSEAQKTNLSDAAKYEVLIETNDAVNAARENVEKVKAYKDAEKLYSDTCDELDKVFPYNENKNEAIWVEADEMDDELEGDAYKDLDNEQLDDLTARIKELTEKVKKAAEEAKLEAVKEEMAKATDDDPYDATSFIVNPDMGTGNADGWTVMALGQNNGYQNNNTYTNGEISLDQFIECWRNGAVLTDGTIEQTTVAALPAGTYTLGADINAKWQNDATVAIEGLFLFVGAAGNTNSVLLDTQDASPKHFEVTFKLDTESSITLGVMAKETNANWLAADNFKLMYYGTASTKEPSGDAGDANGIENVTEQSAKVVVAIYNAAGAQINALQPGINIVKYADGSTKKIFKN